MSWAGVSVKREAPFENKFNTNTEPVLSVMGWECARSEAPFRNKCNTKTLRTGPVLVLNLFSNGASLLTDTPAHDTQNRSCFGVAFVSKWRLTSGAFPSHDTQNRFCSVDIAALRLSHWARGCGLDEQPTASSRFWEHRCTVGLDRDPPV